MPDADTNSKDEATIIRDEDDWLSEEIRDEVRKLQELTQQLDRVAKPEASQRCSQNGLKTTTTRLKLRQRIQRVRQLKLQNRKLQI